MARTQRQPTQRALRRYRAEIRHKVRVFTHDAHIGAMRYLGELIHLLTPVRFWRAWRQQRGFQHCTGIDLHGAQGNIRLAKLEANHLALLGHPQAAVYRTRGLGEYRRVGRAAATTNGAAATVEQG